MEGSGQAHAPVILYPGKGPKYALYRMVCGLQAQFGRFGEGKNTFRPTGSEPPSFCLLSSHFTSCLIPTPVFCKVENFMYGIQLIGSIKPSISTANLLHEI
jgi:hypothetical protein